MFEKPSHLRNKRDTPPEHSRDANQVKFTRLTPEGTREVIGESSISRVSNHATLSFQLLDELLSFGMTPDEFEGVTLEIYVNGSLERQAALSAAEVEIVAKRTASRLIE